jgi:hypothetical protein
MTSSTSPRAAEAVVLKNPFLQAAAFIGTVLIIALLTWAMRSLVEGSPDPFILNFTFFAFVAQCVRSFEFILDAKSIRVLLVLWFLALLVLTLQVIVIRAHRQRTLDHYKYLLDKYKKDTSTKVDIDHWSDALLQITGADVSPGQYQLLSDLFDTTEPWAKKRNEAFSTLPASNFRVTPQSDFTADSLILPEAQRKRLWLGYVLLCVVSWILFSAATFVTTKRA